MIFIKKKTMKVCLTFISLLLIAGCSADESQDNVSGNDAAVMAVSEDQIADQTEGEGNTLSENTEQGAPSVSDQTPSENEVQEEDDGIYYTMEEVKALDIPEDMLAYWLVLHNKMPFISYDEGCQEFYWDEYSWDQGEPDNYLRTNQDIVIVDMDNDGGNEVVLTYGPLGMVEVFHYEDDEVYGCQFVLKGMNRIRENGIYEVMNGAYGGEFRRLAELNKDGYTEEEIAEVIMTYNDDSNNYYEIGGVSVSQEEYEEFKQDLEKIGLAERIEYEESLLDACLLEGLTEEELYMVKHVAMEPMTEMEDYPMDSEIKQAYYDVLTGEKEFISVNDDNKSFYLDEYHQWNGEYREAYQVLYFSFADMDGDGIYEVVLSCSPGVTQILHYEDGNIYSYQYSYRYSDCDVGAMTKEGVFCMDEIYDSQGVVYKYGIIVSFNEDGCDIEEVDYNGDINDDRIRYHYFSEELIEQYLG